MNGCVTRRISNETTHGGYCVVSVDGKWGAMRDGTAGIIDTQGNVLIDFVYDRMPPMDIMCYDLWEMKKDGASGMIDKYGNETERLS